MATFHPILSSPPVRNTNQQSTTTTKEAEVENELLDKETYKILMNEGGLSNDVNQWVDELVTLSSSNDFPFLQGDNISNAAQKIKRLNEVVINKQLWTEAINIAEKQGGLNEVAVGTNGELFVRDKDAKLKAISMSEYAKNKDKYNPLTFYDLMIERNDNPNLAFNNSIFSVSSTAIGTNKIISNISQLVDKVGSYTQTITQTYGDKDLERKAQMLAANITGRQPTQNELEALGKLQTIISSPSSYNEVKESSKNSEKYLNSALTYIWTSLSREEQLKLSAVATMSGINNPKEFIFNMLKSNKDESFELDIQPVTAEKAMGVNTSENKTKTIALSPQELAHMDRLYQPGMTYTMNSPSANTKLDMTATFIGPLFNLKNGEVIQGTVLTDIIEQGNYASIVDPNQAYIGNVKIDPLQMPELAYTGGDVAKVYVPTKNGVPDFAQMDRFNDAYQVFSINKDKWTKQQAEEYFKTAGFSGIRIEEIAGKDGKISKVIAENSAVKPFLSLPVITNSASELSDIPWMVKMLGDEKDIAEQLMEKVFSFTSGTGKNAKTISRMPSKFLSLETPYKGNVLIAYRPEATAIISSMQGNLVGTAPTETDVYRNLNYSSRNYSPGSINASAGVL